jgi:transcriptional regulator
VSSSWYDEGDLVPTWNHVTAHLYGVPEILSEEENYQVLRRLTDHFEHGRPGARSLDQDEAGTRRAAKGTVGLRLRVTRFDARAKLSQNKRPEVVETVVRALAATNPPLAHEMRRVHGAADGTD